MRLVPSFTTTLCRLFFQSSKFEFLLWCNREFVTFVLAEDVESAMKEMDDESLFGYIIPHLHQYKIDRGA